MSEPKIIRNKRYSSTRLKRHSVRPQPAKEAQRAARRVRMKKREAFRWLRRGAPIVPLIERGKRPICEGRCSRSPY